ncbi:MAG TPA: adenosylcobinamide-GDP ribazoletransferase, partial [Nitrospirota bacterium]|nr:adenosylcobinamide-GDP ribazoletransferase [Nitrospirota bacterium]
VRNFMTAVQFLTVLPVSRKHTVNENDLAKSMVYFPFVGFLIGFILVHSDKGLLWLFPDTISNIFLLLLSVYITRALHIDGLSDTLDGLMGGKDRESRLAIMKDSRIGTAGVLGIVFILMLKYSCFNSLFNDYKAAALLTAPVFGRWSQMLMMFKANYGREHGMGKAFVGHLRSGGLAAASVISLGLSAWVIMDDARTVFLAIGIPVAVAACTLLWRWYIIRKIGGVSGDAVGAVSEMNEVLTLLLFVFTMNGR